MKREVSHPGPAQPSRPGRWLVAKSPILGGEEIVVLAHPVFAQAARRAHPDLVVYSPTEVDVLQQHRSLAGYADLFRAVHLLKKTFDGVVIPGEDAAPDTATEHEGAGAAPLAMVPTDDGCGSGSPTAQE